MKFTLKQIRYFVAIAESLSLSKAAKDLHLSQSALTNSLAELETAIGKPIVIRTSKGVQLNHDGHQFLISCHRILAVVAEAEVGLIQNKQEDIGELTIGVTSLVAGYYLSEPLSRFSKNFPAVNVTVREDSQDYIEHQLINGEIDVAILLLSQLGDNHALETETLMRSPLKVWLPVNHPLYKQANVSLQELSDEPMITLTANEFDRIVDRIWRRYNRPARTVLRTESVEAVRNMVGASFGLAILPEFAYRPWTLEMQRVETCNIKEAIPTVDIGVVWRKGSAMNWLTEEFIALAREQSKA